MRTILLFLFSFTAVAEVGSRAQIYRALVETKVLDPERRLVHYSHTCTLRIEGGDYPVVDLEEMVKGASTPRGINRIIVFNSVWQLIREFNYTTERPLFCVANRLYVYGDLKVGNILPEGNVLTFSTRGKTVELSHVEANDYPIPVTRERQSPPQ